MASLETILDAALKDRHEQAACLLLWVVESLVI
ncbi:MAG: hypothetical protein CM15mP74_15600 [Halieaceae bacterium]|nr:MAG: hypothetical protein CM15mP74_15600 [Halieaceae bacterium]